MDTKKLILTFVSMIVMVLAASAQTVGDHKKAIDELNVKMDKQLIKDVGTKGDTLRMVTMMQTQVRSFVEIEKHYKEIIAILEKEKKKQ